MLMFNGKLKTEAKWQDQLNCQSKYLGELIHSKFKSLKKLYVARATQPPNSEICSLSFRNLREKNRSFYYFFIFFRSVFLLQISVAQATEKK